MCICIECLNYSDENACTSALNLQFDNITSVSMGLLWDGSQNADTFSVEFREVGSTTWLILPAITAPTSTATIVGLTPDTQYEFRVNTICASDNCYSLIVKEKTLE